MPDDEVIAAWVAKTCLTFGSQVSTAYKVAGLFMEGLENKRTRSESEPT